MDKTDVKMRDIAGLTWLARKHLSHDQRRALYRLAFSYRPRGPLGGDLPDSKFAEAVTYARHKGHAGPASVRPTRAGVRDALNEDTLITRCLGATSDTAIIHAIADGATPFGSVRAPSDTVLEARVNDRIAATGASMTGYAEAVVEAVDAATTSVFTQIAIRHAATGFASDKGVAGLLALPPFPTVKPTASGKSAGASGTTKEKKTMTATATKTRSAKKKASETTSASATAKAPKVIRQSVLNTLRSIDAGTLASRVGDAAFLSHTATGALVRAGFNDDERQEEAEATANAAIGRLVEAMKAIDAEVGSVSDGVSLMASCVRTGEYTDYYYHVRDGKHGDEGVPIMDLLTDLMLNGLYEEPSPLDEPSVATGAPLPAPLDLPSDPKILAMVNAVLGSVSLPSIEDIRSYEATLRSTAETAVATVESMRETVRKAKAVSMITPVVPGATAAAHAPGELPEGKVVLKTAAKLFGITGADAKAFAFEVPTFEWAFEHPDVPEVDENYLFRPESLITVLLALVKNQQPWLHGHTGTGKSTLVEQVAARLCWPCKRVNFDSEITRMDLVGKDALVTDPKTLATTTKWVDGILPQALRGPFILLLDEIDFVRPDVAYVMQRIGEGKGLMLNENGGEWVKPHPMFRLFATANTVGQGDEHGMYQGARPQSLAFLDRFFPFVEVAYLSEAEEKALIKKRTPDIDEPSAQLIAKYVTEHRQAFTNAQIMQPLSPRGIGAVADSYVTYLDLFGGDKKKSMRKALKDMVFAKASQQDAVVLKGIIDKVVK